MLATFEPDPTIAQATVRGHKTVSLGSRVRHFGQRWTGCATATVVGFAKPGSEHGYGADWLIVLVEPDEPPGPYGTSWDWDRTEDAFDVMFPETQAGLDLLRTTMPDLSFIYHRLPTHGRGWRLEGRTVDRANKQTYHHFTVWPEGTITLESVYTFFPEAGQPVVFRAADHDDARRIAADLGEKRSGLMMCRYWMDVAHVLPDGTVALAVN